MTINKHQHVCSISELLALYSIANLYSHIG